MAVIPRTALLTCTNSDIRDLVMSDHKMVKNCTSSWVPLLLAMAAEYSYKAGSCHPITHLACIIFFALVGVQQMVPISLIGSNQGSCLADAVGRVSP